MGTFGGNGEEFRGHTHGVSKIDHGEASTIDSIRDVGDAQGRSSTGSGGNLVNDDLHRETTGNRGTVGGVAAYI